MISSSTATAGTGTAAAWARVTAAPFLSCLIGCVVLALVSGLVLPTVPSYDPWSWIVWGREVFDPHLSLIIGGGSSWKPFPVIFTSIYGLFRGGPTMWVLTERVGALMAFCGAYRLASQMTARIGYARVAPLAGVIAALSLILLQDFAYYFYRGASEPILVGCALWSVERFIAGKRWESYALGITLGLMRPEVWPLMFLFALWLIREAEPSERRKIGVITFAALAFMPFMWFAPPGITTGNWFSAASQASSYNGHLGAHPLLEVMRRGVDDSSLPVLLLALIAIAITFFRERDRVILGVAGLGLAWWVIVELETAKGYPGLERFYLPAAAMAAVLGGVGVIRIGALLGEFAGRAAGASLVRPVAVLATVITVALAYTFVDGRVTYTKDQYSLTKVAVTRLNNLASAVAAIGGHDAVFPCKSPMHSYAAINHSLQTALAWKLHSTLERVGTRLSYQGVLFVGPKDSIDGGPAVINPYYARPYGQYVFIKQVGVFKMYRVYRKGHYNHCVGA